MRRLFPILLLAACAARDDSEPPATDAAAEDLCGASGYASLIGANIAAVTLPVSLNHRVIYPDTAVTRDYRRERLNIDVTADGTVTGLRCG